MKLNLPMDGVLDFLIVRAALEKHHADEANKLTNPNGKHRTPKDEMQEGYVWGIEQLIAKMEKMEEKLG